MNKLEKAAHIAVRQCLDVKRNETVLVLADEPLMELASILWKAALDCKANAMLLQIPFMGKQEGEPYEAVAKLMRNVNVIITPTTYSITHSKALRQACGAGARVITMPGITHNTFSRIINADFKDIAEKSRKVADILTIGREATITSVNGTNLKIPIHGKIGLADTGLVLKPGQRTSLPAGEASVLPVEGVGEGTLVVDSGMDIEPNDVDKITMTIKDGYAIRIKGGDAAEKLRKRLQPYSPMSRKIAELGVGTNDAAKLCWETLADKKVAGTVHIALGNNTLFGGNNDVPVHIDGIIHKPTLEIDGRVIVKNGKLRLN